MATANSGSSDPLARSRRAWPWGLVVFADPSDKGEIPSRLDADRVACTKSTIVAAILHAVDGDALAEVRLGQPPPGLVCIHLGDFSATSGVIELADAGREAFVSAPLRPGSYRARVLVDSVAHAEHVVLLLESV